MNELFAYLLPTALIAAGVFATTAFVFIRSNISPGWKALAIPSAFIASAVVPFLVALQLGYSLPTGTLPEKARILQHQTVVEKGKKKRIEVWLAEPKSPTRLISVPYSKELEKLLQLAEKARQQGLVSELRRGKQEGEVREGFDSNDLHLDLQRPQDLLPRKDGQDEEDEKPDFDKLLPKDGSKPGLVT